MTTLSHDSQPVEVSVNLCSLLGHLYARRIICAPIGSRCIRNAHTSRDFASLPTCKKKGGKEKVHFSDEVGVALMNSSLQRVRAALLRAQPKG